MSDKLEVYKAIAKVQGEIAKTGISKERNNAQQQYKFRGIDDVYNALSPILAGSGLVIMPRVLGRSVTDRTNSKGNVLIYVTVEVEYDFVSTVDGSKHTVKVYGEAMDSGDKATNKAMSAAHKYAMLQTFCIPTEGDNDADSTTHELAKEPEKPKPTISKEEASQIRGMLKALDGYGEKDEVKILKAYSVKEGKRFGSLEELPLEYYEAICKALDKLIAEKSKLAK